MDPLDDVFSAMRVHSALHARLECAAPWGISLAGGQAARFGLVVNGRCRLEAKGEAPVEMSAGDCYVLAHGTPYVLRDGPNSPAVSCMSVSRSAIGGKVALGMHANGRANATVLCGWFHFDAQAAQPLLSVLPRLLHVTMDAPRALALQGTLQLLAMETESPGLGSGLVVSRLADILFAQAVRAHVATVSGGEAGWLGALCDARVGAALRAMHANIAKAWSVDELAATASLSRSAFALRFRQRVGQSPLDYLTRWRMYRARHLLRDGSRSLGDVASAVGYESEPAFSKAFKRNTGAAPGAWRASAKAPTPTGATAIE